MNELFGLVIVIGIIAIWVWLMFKTHSMAIAQNRTGWGWVLVALFVNPIFTVFVLWLLKPTNKAAD